MDLMRTRDGADVEADADVEVDWQRVVRWRMFDGGSIPWDKNRAIQQNEEEEE